MIGYRYIVAIVIASFVMSLLFVGGGIFLQLSGSRSSNNFLMLSLPFNYIGVLAAPDRHQSARLIQSLSARHAPPRGRNQLTPR